MHTVTKEKESVSECLSTEVNLANVTKMYVLVNVHFIVQSYST